MSTPTENDKRVAQLKAFLKSSGKSPATVAMELRAILPKDPNGRPISADKINNYQYKRAKLQDWFMEAMDQAYPGWRVKTDTENGRQTTIKNADNSGLVKMRDMPVVPSLGEPDMKESIESVSQGRWEGRTSPALDFFNLNLPLQFVRDASYAPAFMPGDAVLLDTGAQASVDSLFLIFADGEFVYAALMVHEGKVAWVKYDGTVIPFDEGMIEAALVVHLPQYEHLRDVGTFSRRGLRRGLHVKWPKEK